VIVVIVSQVIYQRKWEWCGGEQARPLSDLQQFDSGSRGLWGAMHLIPTVLWKDLVTLIAAVVLLVSFLEGPFVQQASRTKECSFVAPGLNASLLFAHYVPRRGGFIAVASSPAEPGAAPHTSAAILSGIVSPDGVENQISASCSTGNCTFPFGDPGNAYSDFTTSSTVGMCSKCTDIAPLVSNTGNSSENVDLYSLPNGYNFTNGRSYHDVTRIGAATDLAWMGDLLTPELNFFCRRND
jgi:hypothetical protein